MSISNSLKSIGEKTPAEMKAEVLELYSSMPPKRFFEYIRSNERMAVESGRDSEREELVCRLLASGMTVDEISLLLCLKKEKIHTIEYNHSSIKIPKYSKALNLRKKRREAHIK